MPKKERVQITSLAECRRVTTSLKKLTDILKVKCRTLEADNQRLQAEAAVLRNAAEAYVKMVSAYGIDHPAIQALNNTTAGASLLEELRLLRVVEGFARVEQRAPLKFQNGSSWASSRDKAIAELDAWRNRQNVR